MSRWRIYTPFVCRVVIEETDFHAMRQFNGLNEEDVVQKVKENILYRWPAAELRDTTHFGHQAIDVSRDGNFYYEEPDTTAFLYVVARGY